MAITDFRFVYWNANGQRHSSYWSWISRRGKILKRLKYVLNEYKTAARASVYALVETTQSEAAWYANGLGKEYKGNYVTSPGYGAIIHHRDWKRGRKFVWYIDRAHDVLVQELERDGVRMNFVVMHLPPDLNGKSAQAAREKAFRMFVANTKGWRDPFVIGIDANWAKTFEGFAAQYGFLTVRGSNTKPTKGTRIIDYVLVKNGATRRWYEVLRGDGSDHEAISTGLTGRD